MNIHAVNNIQVNKSNPMFKGLWGKTSCTPSDFDPGLNIPKREYSYYYYPFADDTEEDIKKAKGLEKAEVDYSEAIPKYVVHNFKLCTTLPMQKKDYEHYKNIVQINKLSENSLKSLFKIHQQVADKYLTSDYGDGQVSAAHETLAKKFIDLNM